MSLSVPNAVEYAERTLDVHGAYADALSKLVDYNAASAIIDSCNVEIRKVKERLADRERVIIDEERGKHYDMGATAFKAHVKEVVADDTEVDALRNELADEESKRDSAHSDARTAELGLSLHVARMNELAGLLNFYAAAKNVQTEASNARPE